MSWLCIKSPVPFCKAFTREVEDGHLTVFVGQEPMPSGPKWHLSISHRSSKLISPQTNAPLPVFVEIGKAFDWWEEKIFGETL